MRDIQILTGFTGYPNGKKRAFSPGVEHLADDYADLLVAKGLAKEIPTKAAAKPLAKDGDDK